jgi:hypothetical protein
MLKEWLISDIEEALAKSSRVVISDPFCFLTFMVKELSDYTVITINHPTEEMEARCEAQVLHANSNVILLCFFSSQQVVHLREFAGVGGYINFDNPEEYLRRKLYEALGVNVTLPKDKLLFSAKVSIGKDLKWWKNIVAGTIEPLDIFEYLPLLVKDPKEFQINHDEDVYRMFRRELFRLMKVPEVPVDAPQLLAELAQIILSGLAYNKISPALLKIYDWWTNSSAHQPYLKAQIDNWTVPADVSPLKAHPDHPFEEVDRRLLRFIAEKIRQNQSWADIKEAIERRIHSARAAAFKSVWLKDLLVLLDFDSTDMYRYDTFAKLVNYYGNRFSKMDTAMRHIYAYWLNEPKLLRPIQELYERHLNALLGNWSLLAPPAYQPSQLGLIGKSLTTSPKCAVIVCDGLRLEIANAVADTVASSQIEVVRNHAFAKLPSVTENGMSALFGLDEVTTSTIARADALKTQMPDVRILPLTDLSATESAPHLVLLYGDIDNAGEHKGLAALKDINNYETVLADTIKRLLRMGYAEVTVTADHGFVITGILDEASKVSAPQGGDVKERFFVTDEAISDAHWIRREDDFPGGKYQYYACTDRPFRSRGAYGYAHGGFTPQECIIPAYTFKSLNSTQPHVKIANKEELRTVTGQYFSVHLKGDDAAAELRVRIALYDGENQLAAPLVKLNQYGEGSAEFELNVSEASVVVMDASTSTQYDHSTVKKSQSRDIDF